MQDKIYCILLLISLVMVLGGGLLAYLIQTVAALWKSA